MKKLLSVLLCLTVLCGCGTETSTETAEAETETVTITNSVDLNVLSDPADMSGYVWLDDDDPAFTEISLQESIKLFAMGGSGIVVYSADTCPFCNRAIPVLDSVLKEYGVKAYYVDTNTPIASSSELSYEIYEELCSYISDIFELDENGDPMFQIPEVIAAKDGKIVGHHLSLVDSFTLVDSDTQLTDEEAQELADIYRNLIELAAD